VQIGRLATARFSICAQAGEKSYCASFFGLKALIKIVLSGPVIKIIVQASMTLQAAGR